jgi:hypothetical protein
MNNNKLFKNEQQETHLDTKNEKLSTLSWIFIVLVHWNNSLWVDMSLHSEILFWFWADQSLFLLLNAACLSIL